MNDHHHTLLIVDDEPNVRLVFRVALDLFGDTVVEARDGEEALEWLTEARADLVVLDLLMPGLGGMDVLHRLRDRGNDVPVVIVTAHGSIPDVVEAMNLGAIDFLEKPVAPGALRAVVAEVLARHDSRKSTLGSREDTHERITVASQVAAKRALNNRWFEEAEVYLRRAIGLDPRSAEAHNLLGILHELRNEPDESYREYRAALKADRHYQPAKQNMRRYYERFTFGRSDVPIDTGER